MQMYPPQKRSSTFLVCLIVAVFAFMLGWQATSLGVIGSAVETKSGEQPVAADSAGDVDMELFWTVWQRLQDQYIHEESLKREDNMVYGAIKGMVDALEDPYTVFMTPEESKEFNASLDGKLEGIGAELTVEEQNLVIVTPLRKSPAEKAGLLPGDIIFKIEDELATEMSLIEAVTKIRGEKGSTVTLTIVREGVDAPFEVSIVRDSIDIESVSVEELEGDIIYLSVNQFNDKTDEEFSKAISGMLLDEPGGIIIDLRFNGGGYLDIAVELLSYLLPSDTEAVTIKERSKEDEVILTNGNPKVLNVPLVVIVNDSSASASEIVAGAIQDHGRGVVMGVQSFGKGTVQEVDTFDDGSSIRMTIAKWFTPEGRDIDAVGITPDIIVEISEEDIENEFDAQKEAATEYLRGL